MTAEQAGWTSWDEFIMRKEGKEQEERLEWERARWMMFTAMQMHPYIKQERKPKTPQGWIEFPWEKKQTERKPPKRLRVTKKEQAILREVFDKLDK